ncbi:MAG: L-threonylcarbamoyladenylate synthase [Asgard group archaeon]|nr:L-threonylcarbamoyladenylate synthase [Asgard group archaeon]
MDHINTKKIKIDPLNISDELINIAAKFLLSGEIVAFPTETVYGLGAIATDSSAIKKIFKIKNRPLDNPLICHFHSIDHISKYVQQIPDELYELNEKLWPGPLTVILFKKNNISPLVTKDLPTIAVRIPSNPIILALIKKINLPLAAPSANLSGLPSPTKAEHVISDFKNNLPLVIDGGDSKYGMESTVIDLTTTPPKILRPGAIPFENIKKILPNISTDKDNHGRILSPGMKYKHYSPKTKIIVIKESYIKNVQEIEDLVQKIKGKKIILCTNKDHKHSLNTIQLGSNLKNIQTNLYSSFRELDNLNLEFGIFEEVIDEKEGSAIMDRVKKASFQIL